MDNNDILTYEDITKIKLTSEGFLLKERKLEEYIKLEEFKFIDKDGDEQVSDYLFYMMRSRFCYYCKRYRYESIYKIK